MKGSLNAFEFADIVEAAFLNTSNKFNVRKVPVADGGDFTGEVLKHALNAKDVYLTINGPLGGKVKTKYAFSKDDTAIIEMADASGMKLVQENQLNPMEATSFGTGQLVLDAIEKGCTQIYLGIGGSATVDGGAGMLEALGFKLMDGNGNKLKGCGKNLVEIQNIRSPEKVKNIRIKIISDVDNPLLGEQGAAQVFGPQKGASPEMVKKLENGLENWSNLLEKENGRNLQNIEGAGAAGGVALPLITFFNAEIVPGADFILQQLDFETHLKWADLVITGEGKIDGQTLNTKAPMAVAKMSRRFGKPVIALGGSVDYKATDIFDGIFSIINKPLSLQDAMKKADVLLSESASQIARLICALKMKK